MHVPPVVVAGSAGPGMALIAIRSRPGRCSPTLDPAEVTDAMLDDLWKQVAALHDGAGRARRAERAARHGRRHHRRASPTSSSRSSAAGSGRRAADVAELLVSSALLVGDDRAVAAADAGMGHDAIVEALPYLQPAALSRDLRTDRRHRKQRSKEVASVRAAAAAAVGTDEPPLQELYRVSGTNLLMAVGTLIAVFALLSQVGDPQEFWDTITAPNWSG